MKRLFAFLLLLLLLIPKAHAIDFKSSLKFAGGMLSGFMIHECGHYLAAEITGTDIETEFFTNNQVVSLYSNPESDRDGRYINSAGLITQVISSEIILDTEINRGYYFVKGLMFFNVLNPILYAADYWFINRINKIENNSFQGDISGIEYYSDRRTANIFAGTMLLLAAWQGYRFYTPNESSFNIVPMRKAVGLKFVYNF